MADPIAERIARATGIPGLVEVLADRLDAADLHSLLLAVARRRAATRTPADVLRRYREDRFARPAGRPAGALDTLDAAADAALPPGFERLELAPVCPLGTSSVLGGISQDRVLATTRSLEVVSDPTNVLALECAVRRRGDRRAIVRLAASHRALRTPPTEEPYLPHFRIFALCSAGRAGDEAAMLDEQLAFFARLLADVAHTIDRGRRKQSYYDGETFAVVVDGREVAEGGFVDWTARLLGDRKERLLIAGLGTDLLATLRSR